MTDRTDAVRATSLALLMLLSVVAGAGVAVGSPTASTDSVDVSTQDNGTAAELEPDSAKPLTISWFRSDGDANGPYPVPPMEYEGEEEPGINLFTNAEGDAQLRVDNATARNPNGQWDMLTLHAEASGLEALEPPAEGPEKGLVTQNFIENDNWDVEITQVDGDKELDVAANQEGYEPAPVNATSGIPPVMVFADTEEIDGDFTVGSEPDTGLFVWVDPNRAVLTEDGEETSFEPGEEYEATFSVGDGTDTTTFEMVDGDVRMNDSLAPANTVDGQVTGESTLAGGSQVEVVVETEDGETQSETVEVEGDKVLMDSDSAASAPWGHVSGAFDFSGHEGESFDVRVYAPGPANATIDGEPARDEDEFLSEENRLLVANGSGTVRDVVDPNYTIDNATIRDSKTMTIAYHNPAHETAVGVGEQVGDGHASGDNSIAKNVDAHGMFDEMWVHYETSDEIFEAIERSPGASQAEKFVNSPLSFEVRQTNADGEPKVLDLSRNASGVFVAPDEGESDQRIYNSSEQTGIFFSMLPNEMTLYQDGEPVDPAVGEEYEATLTIDTEAGVREETTTFSFVEGRTVLANQADLELSQAEGTEIVFNSTQARGTAMDVRLVATADNGTVIFDESTGETGLTGLGPQTCCDGGSTAPWGTLSGSFDTSDIPLGTDVTAYARIVADLPDQDVAVVEQVNGSIRAPPSANISLSAQTGDGASVTVDEVGLSDGGFVSVHTGSANGPTVGESGYLDAGVHEGVEIELDQPVDEDTTLYVTAHVDDNNNQEFDFPAGDDPYTTESGEPVSASADYTVESTDTATATDEPTETATDEPTDMATDSDGDATATDASGPGFGLVGALVALLGAALLARRD